MKRDLQILGLLLIICGVSQLLLTLIPLYLDPAHFFHKPKFIAAGYYGSICAIIFGILFYRAEYLGFIIITLCIYILVSLVLGLLSASVSDGPQGTSNYRPLVLVILFVFSVLALRAAIKIRRCRKAGSSLPPRNQIVYWFDRGGFLVAAACFVISNESWWFFNAHIWGTIPIWLGSLTH